ncbi:hypothetical protein, partial [Mesorhizobium sp. M2E.F.Ca.ET.166.01.1.1]|uniref:hypothetical protein n=1 Tax=Mesorhizobium sp. M2E.F.Ca.ET.166.01.1.1 TaxID=2500523 RepID=UPI001AEDE186
MDRARERNPEEEFNRGTDRYRAARVRVCHRQPGLEQFQEKCVAVFRSGLRKHKELERVCFPSKLNRSRQKREGFIMLISQILDD